MKTKYSFTQVSALGAVNAKPQVWDFDGLPVTPANATLLPDGTARGLICTGGGNIAVTLDSGATALITAAPANTIMLMNVTIVAATNTTATGISALY